MIPFDIVLTSASRPEYLFPTLESIKQNVKYSNKIRFIVHEDVLIYERSKKNLNKLIESYDNIKIVVSRPRIGLGGAIFESLKYVQSDYFFKMEDDWSIVKEIDLNLFEDFMNKYDNVNQIIFNKRKTLPKKHAFEKREIEFENDFWLTTTMYFGLLPAIWRTSFAKKYWKRAYHPVREFDKIEFNRPEDADSDWYIKNIGCYYYGRIGQEPLVSHIGGDKRTVEIGGAL